MSVIFSELTRRTVRYWCFRLQNEASGGASASGEDDSILDAVKLAVGSREAFGFAGGWATFGVTWDLSEDEPFEIVALQQSLLEKWNAEVWERAEPLPAKTPVRSVPLTREDSLKEVVYDIDVNSDGTSFVEVTEVHEEQPEPTPAEEVIDAELVGDELVEVEEPQHP